MDGDGMSGKWQSRRLLLVGIRDILRFEAFATEVPGAAACQPPMHAAAPRCATCLAYLLRSVAARCRASPLPNAAEPPPRPGSARTAKSTASLTAALCPRRPSAPTDSTRRRRTQAG